MDYINSIAYEWEVNYPLAVALYLDNDEVEVDYEDDEVDYEDDEVDYEDVRFYNDDN